MGRQLHLRRYGEETKVRTAMDCFARHVGVLGCCTCATPFRDGA